MQLKRKTAIHRDWFLSRHAECHISHFLMTVDYLFELINKGKLSNNSILLIAQQQIRTQNANEKQATTQSAPNKSKLEPMRSQFSLLP